MEIVIQEFRLALRSLLRAPLFTSVAVLCLTLAIGAVTTVYSVFHAVIMNPFPFVEPDRVIQVDTVALDYDKGTDPRISMREASWDFFRDNQTVFDEAYLIAFTSFAITGVEKPFQLVGSVISPGAPAMLGMTAENGRILGPDDADRNVAMLSYRGWQASFGGDEDIVGQSVNVNGNPHEIVGVLRPDHQYFPQADLIVPMHNRYKEVDNNSTINMNILGRLRDGDHIDPVNQRLETLSQQAAEVMPSVYNSYKFHGMSITELNSVGNTAFTMRVLLASVLALLLIAAANVANLMLARVHRQEQELALRSALGARRRHIVRRLMIENCLLGLFGVALGSLTAIGLLPVLVQEMGVLIPNPDRVGLNLDVFLFAVTVTISTVLVLGLVPIVRATGINLAAAIRDGGNKGKVGGGAGLRKILVVGEVAIAFVLLVSAGLMFRSFHNIQNIDPGYDPDQVQTIIVNVPNSRTGSPASIFNFYDELRTELLALPQVEEVGFASQAPIADRNVIARLSVEDFPPENPQDVLQPYPFLHIVSSGYFESLEIPLVSGRYFDERDREDSAPVIIINQAFADHLWPGENVIGKRIKRYFYNDEYPWHEVVGVVENVRGVDGVLQNPAPLSFYLPMRQAYSPSRGNDMRVSVKTTTDPAAALDAIRDRTLQLDSDTVLSSELTMRERLNNSTRSQRANMFLLTLLAVIGLALAVSGIFGVISFTTQQRLREIGLRMALGARKANIFGMVVGGALLMGGIGLIVGLLLMLSAGTAISDQLYRVNAFDVSIYGGIMALTLVTVLLAAWIPAARASRTDPVIALRED